MIMLYNGGNDEEALMIVQDLNFPSYNESINLTRFPGAFYLDVDKNLPQEGNAFFIKLPARQMILKAT